MSEGAYRYAIYWAPPTESELARFGAAWLGRDAEADRAIPGLLSIADQALVAEPRRYGLHATLKPPFALRDAADIGDLELALARFATGRKTVPLGPLALTDLKGFLALCPPQRLPALHELADDCVRDFDRFRAPATAQDIAKRRASGLTPAQESHLLAWGYPYVLDQFQFHVTLSQRLEPEPRARLRADLETRLATVLETSFEINDLALFEEPTPGAPFRLRRRFRLG
jgi:putative phosphonate metabolism protein